MPFNYVSLEKVLHPEQEYVTRIATEQGIKLCGVHHKHYTNTCFEKAGILKWDPNRVVKAIFLNNDSVMYGFVFPELGSEDNPLHISRKDLFPRIFGITPSKAKAFRNSVCPTGMEFGTCTPFVFDKSFESGQPPLGKIFVHEMLSLDKMVVDISIGGFGEEAHRTSVHLPYGALYEILHRQFGDERLKKVKLF